MELSLRFITSTHSFSSSRILPALCSIAFLLALAGCNSAPAPPPIAAPQDDAPQLSDALDINVYLDGSGSIKHFLQSTPGGPDAVQPNYFRDLLDKGETTLHNAPGNGHWKDVSLNFYRFGSGRTPTLLAPNGGLQQMSADPSRFNEGNTLIETPIQATSPASSRNSTGEPRPELKIIITDLYQSNGQLERPADALADKYLGGDADAVGVLAVRNRFTGAVEDLPGTPRGKTLPNAADTMPFYVIAAGPAADVRHALEVLEKGTGLDGALARGLATTFFFTRASRAIAHPEFKLRDASYSTVSSNFRGQHIPLLQLSSGKLKATWTDPFDTENHTVPLGEEDLEFKAFAAASNGSLTEDPVASEAAQPCPGILLCATIDRAKLTQGRTYVFRINRVAPRPADTLQPNSAAVRLWNIEMQQAEQISASPNPQFPAVQGLRDQHPGMTPDLSKFLKALQGRMFRDTVKLTSYYLYVQAN